MAEVLAHAGHIGPEVMNCSAPDTGNMGAPCSPILQPNPNSYIYSHVEVLARYGSPEQQQKWLVPLLNGEIRSAFSMTEKNGLSTDSQLLTHPHSVLQLLHPMPKIFARLSVKRAMRLSSMVINGTFNQSYLSPRVRLTEIYRWISGAGDPRTKLHLVMGKSDPHNKNSYNQQSVVIVPADAPGVKIIRPMKVFGYDDAPEGHCEIIYENVRVPLGNLVLGWGRGFEIIQGRLGCAPNFSRLLHTS